MTSLQQMYVREVPCASKPRLGEPSRAFQLFGALRPGVALCGAVAFLGIVGLAIGPRRRMYVFAESKGDIASLAVKKYAYEAYPSWAAVHPDQACPRRLEELNEYTNARDVRDPWGGHYVMLCGANLPDGAKHFAVESPGADSKWETADDVRSW